MMEMWYQLQMLTRLLLEAALGYPVPPSVLRFCRMWRMIKMMSNFAFSNSPTKKKMWAVYKKSN